MSETPTNPHEEPNPRLVFDAVLDTVPKDAVAKDALAKEEDNERKTRPIPEQEKIDRSFEQIYGVKGMTSESGKEEIQSSMAGVMETLNHLMLDDAMPNYGMGTESFGHPFMGQAGADQAGIAELGEQIFKLWLEQARAWQSYVEQLYGNGGSSSWSNLFDYGSIFAGAGETSNKKANEVVVVANRQDIEAKVHWRETPPETDVHCHVISSIEGQDKSNDVQVKFQVSLDGATQVMSIDVADSAMPGAYVGVILDDNGQDFGYLRIALPG